MLKSLLVIDTRTDGENTVRYSIHVLVVVITNIGYIVSIVWSYI